MADDLDGLRKELQDEYEQFRERFGEVLEAMSDVERAGPEDDIHHLLEILEDKVKEARTGGLVGSGAKGHRRAREKYIGARGG